MNNASLELGGDNWAAKDGNLLGYAVGDSSGKYVPNEFTFTRGSNLSATRVNEDGYIEKGYENLLLQSNSFTTSPWNISETKYNLTSGQAGYDGSNDAWFLEKITTSNNYFGQSVVSVGSVYTVSLRAKADSANSGILLFFGTPFLNVDLEAKNVYARRNSIFDSVTDIGNGWVEIVFTFVASSTSTNFQPTTNNLTGQTGSIYIQDFQINQGLVAYPYIETTAASVGAGVLENEPRIDYSSGTASLLLEPQRTNLITYSEYITSVNNGSTSYNATESPEGLLNAPIFTATSADPFVRSANFSITTGDTYTMSFYIKGFGTSIGKTCGASATTLGGTTFTLTGSWQRISYSEVSTSTRTNAQLRVDAPNVGAVVGEQFSVWGMQVEQASYPTSYIPTYGVSQTRADDLGSTIDILANPIAFGANDDFTFYYEGSFDKDGNNGMVFGGGNAGFGNDYRNYLWLTANGMLLKGNSETSMASVTFNQAKNTNYKLLVKRGGSRIDFFINGTKIPTTQNSTNTAFTLRSVGWSYSNTVYQVSGNIKQFKALPTALNDNECIELTTI